MGTPKVLDSILDGVGQGIPVSMLTDLLLTGAVAQGIHSIDISMMIAPVIQDYIVNLLEEEGVEFKEFFEDNKDEDIRKNIALSAALTGLKERKPEDSDEDGKSMEEEPESVEEEVMEAEPKRGGGLMAREQV